MTDVLIVCVREDEAQADTLADLFEREGMSVGGAPSDEAALKSCGAAVVIWSQASIRSRPFLDAAQRVVNAGKAVIACLIDPPPASSLNQSPCFDLKGWSGASEDPLIDPLYFAVDRMVNAFRPRAPEPAPAQYAPAAAPQRTSFTPPPAPTYAAPPAPNYGTPPPYARARAAQPAPQRAYEPPPAPSRRAPSMRAPMPPAEPGPRAADPIDPLSAEALRWKAIRHSRDPAAFLHYLSEYGPDGAFSELAEMRLKQLEESNATPLKAAARAGRSRPEPPPARREPPPPRREPPPTMLREPQPMALEPDYDVREPAYAEFEPDYREREPVGAYRSPPPAEYRAPEQRRGGGGAIRLLFLFVLLGGGAVAAGMYFGAGQLQDAPDVASVAEASEPRSAEASADPLASSSVDDADGPATAVGGPTQAEEAQFDLPTPSSAPPAPAPTSAPDPYAREGRLSDRAAPPPVRFEVMGAAAQSPTPLLPPTAAPSNTQLASIEPAPQRPLIARGAEVIWQTRANASQFSAVYPQAARGASVAGRVQLNCAIQSDRSAACQIVGETPAGYGFGDAALRVARYYRARATLDDGTTSVGAQAALNITFRPSD